MAKITNNQIARAVLAMLEDGQKPSAVATSLAGYLVSERRTRDLDTLVRDLETLRFRRDGIVEATVVSANDLDKSVAETIKQLMNARHVHLHHRLEPDVVGGVRVHTLDKQLDLSIKSKLTQLKSLTR